MRVIIDNCKFRVSTGVHINGNEHKFTNNPGMSTSTCPPDVELREGSSVIQAWALPSRKDSNPASEDSLTEDDKYEIMLAMFNPDTENSLLTTRVDIMVPPDDLEKYIVNGAGKWESGTVAKFLFAVALSIKGVLKYACGTKSDELTCTIFSDDLLARLPEDLNYDLPTQIKPFTGIGQAHV